MMNKFFGRDPSLRKENTAQKSKKSLLDNNYILMAISIFAAFAIWVGISFSDTTTETTRTIYDVELQYGNLPDSVEQLGLEVIENTASVKKVNVRISGKQYIVNQITAADLNAYIRLSEATSAGAYTAEIRVDAIGRNKDFSIVSVDPQIVNVRLDRMTTKEYSLEAETNNYKPKDGYTLKMPTLSENTVTITGPASDMQQIARVVARAEVDPEISSTKTYPAMIKLYDEFGKEISNPALQISMEETELTIVAMTLKTVPIEVTYLNAPFQVRDNMVTISPREIEVSVPSDMADELDKLNVGSIDFSKVNKTDNRFTFDLYDALPSGCSIESVYGEAAVTISMVGMSTRDFVITNISVLTKEDTDTIVNLITKSVRVQITGPAEEIEQINESELMIQVDMTSNKNSLGQHELPATVLLEQAPGCWVNGSPTVFVEILEKPEEEVSSEPTSSRS